MDLDSVASCISWLWDNVDKFPLYINYVYLCQLWFFWLYKSIDLSCSKRFHWVAKCCERDCEPTNIECPKLLHRHYQAPWNVLVAMFHWRRHQTTVLPKYWPVNSPRGEGKKEERRGWGKGKTKARVSRKDLRQSVKKKRSRRLKSEQRKQRSEPKRLKNRRG